MVKRSYKQFCPIARTLDIVGERWTLLIVRELLRGPKRYTDLRQRLPGMASNLLAQRMTQMEAAGLVVREHRAHPDPRDVYLLTDRGFELKPVLMALARFGLHELGTPTEDEPLQPELLPDGLAALVLTEELSDDELVIQFFVDEGEFTMYIAAAADDGFRATPAARISVIEGRDTTRADVIVTSSMLVLLLLRRGELAASAATADGLLELERSPATYRQVRRLLGFDRRTAPAD